MKNIDINQHATRHNLYPSIFMFNINCDKAHKSPWLAVRKSVLIAHAKRAYLKMARNFLVSPWQHVHPWRSAMMYLSSVIFLEAPTISFITVSTKEGISNLASWVLWHADLNDQSNDFHNTDPSTLWLAWKEVERSCASATRLIPLGQERLPKEVVCIVAEVQVSVCF